MFKIPETAETFAIPVSRSPHRIKTNNILAAIVYDPTTYENVNVVNIILMVCYIGSLIVGSVLMFFRKMMAL